MSRILIVDDDEVLRRMLCQVLVQAGYEVLAAVDGAAALELYRQQPVDLVITDLIMPHKEGIETILELRRLKPDQKILVMSGGGRIAPAVYLALARPLGAAMALAKPFASEEFLEAVAGLLNQVR